MNTKHKVPNKNNKSTISMEFNHVPKSDTVEFYQHQSEELDPIHQNKIKYREDKHKMQNSFPLK